jgi:hypothetical protein
MSARLTPRARLAAAAVPHLEALEERALPSALGLLGRSGPQPAPLDVLPALVTPVLAGTVVPPGAVAVPAGVRLAVPVVGSVSLEPHLSLTPSAGQPVDVSLSAAATLLPETGGSSLHADAALLGPEGTQVGVSVGDTAGAPVAVTLAGPVGAAPTSLLGGTGPATAGVAGEMSVFRQAADVVAAQPAAAAPRNDLARLVTAANPPQPSAGQPGQPAAGPATTGVILAAAQSGGAALAAAARQADPGGGGQALAPEAVATALLFAPGGSQTPDAAADPPTPAGAAAVPASAAVTPPARTLPPPAGVEEEAEPPATEEPDLIAACPAGTLPALDVLMERLGEGLRHVGGPAWLEWAPWVGLLGVAAAAYGVGRRRAATAAALPRPGTDTLSP